MGGKFQFSVGVLLLSLLFLFASLAVAEKDPELKQCQHQCKQQRQYDEREKEECMKRCEEYYREKKEGERHRREEKEGGQEDSEWSLLVDEQRECLQRCTKQWGGTGKERALCRLGCQIRYKREAEREEEEDEGYKRREEEEKQEQEGENPYVFEEKHFTRRVETEHGIIDVLQKFTQKSKLLRGLENYRLGVIKVDPQSFVAPSHFDADAVLFFAGRGTISMIREGKRESYNFENGDVILVPAGTPVYLINRDERQKLCVVNLLRPVNIPDEYKAFHGPGGEDPETFYKAFSWELLEAALKTDREQLKRIFRQRQGVITKASKEQIEALSQREEGGGIWPFGAESSRPLNLFRKGPVRCNNYGQLFEVTPDDCKHLRDLDLAVSFANITQGSMIGPYYNTRSTKIGVVVEGEGYFEMACPHLSSSSGSRRQEEGTRVSEEGRRPTRYQKVSSRLTRGTVFVVPAGHPVAAVASEKNNLKVLCFEVNAKGNTRYPLAGKRNVISEIEREAKELAFGVPAREVDQVFGNQNEEMFFPGPSRRQHKEGRAYE